MKLHNKLSFTLVPSSSSFFVHSVHSEVILKSGKCLHWIYCVKKEYWWVVVVVVVKTKYKA